MAHPSITESGLIGETIRGAVRRSEESIGGLTINLASEVTQVSGCCQEMVHSVTEVLGHLSVDEQPSSHLLLVDRDHLSRAVPTLSWQWHGNKSADVTGRAEIYQHQDLLLASSSDATAHLLITRRHNARDLSAREVVRLVLQPFVNQRGVDTVHGGTLGDSSTAVLLTGRGGSGKSTLISAGVNAGFRTLGEDFLLAHTSRGADNGLELYSLFATAKLEDRSPALGLFESQGRAYDGKHVVSLTESHPQAVVARQNITALVICRVGPEASLEPSTPERMIEEILPHSVTLTYYPQRLSRFVCKVARELPCYQLISGPDFDKTLDLVRSLVQP